VLLYTDGVTETVGEEGRFGLDRLRRFVADHAGSPPQALLDGLAAELERFRGGEATDDVAALALRPSSA
jgi:sigma-B regulation protein RsbU (phosphoserine phosphatase)